MIAHHDLHKLVYQVSINITVLNRMIIGWCISW